MSRTRLVVGVLCIASWLVPAKALAQDSSLVSLLRDTFVRQIVLSRTNDDRGNFAHDPVFAQDPRVTGVTDLIQQINQQIASQVSVFPLGSSSGGFTYQFDPALGTFTRSSQTFGPAFAERANTLGRQRFNFGINYLRSTYSSLDGRDLEDGGVNFYLLHQDLPDSQPGAYVDGDVLEARLSMDLVSQTVLVFGNVGVTDQFDIGIAIPIQHVSMDMTYDAVILDVASGASSPQTHVFANGQKNESFSAKASASGIGDIVVRAKYNFYRQDNAGLALGVDLRLPTGNEDDMLGTGSTQTKVYLITSGTGGRVSPHANVGYTFASGGLANDQFNYVGGLEIRASPTVTFVADLIGRTFLDTYRLADVSEAHQYRTSDNGPLQSMTLEGLDIEEGTLTSILGTVGIKANPAPNLLLSAHVLVSLTDGGLRTKFTPVLGIDFSF